ncbi:phenylalanyl-tRNA ligase subunit beta [Corynebacterium renale]|uniref:phenylalanine--tRNA ligase subunit beta n=1 Tax=Corynebacterium renale TaxID=1724 RepID=UPI000DA422F3|nr:phenylalanine--tRNA ligase subunit beta [Corynebacterium renale]SQG64615.1 phenylalanyl-tRNA ligase subunit beta [Corynebacterium renale]
MLISQNWVTRILGHANPGWSVSAEDLDSGFVRVGFETEGYEAIEETSGPLVIGRVETIEELTGFKKPIRFCHLDVGQANGTGELQEIVCGARNFAEGDYVVVLLPGAVLPGGFAIAARKTYDHMSNGMICSAAELGLASQQTTGIINLGKDSSAFGLNPGDDARDFLGLNDTIFDVNVTPDRGYALSARGMVRELASAFNITLVDVAANPEAAGHSINVPAVSGEILDVTIDDDTQTRRFGLRAVRGIDPNIESPYWMQEQLLKCGARPVNLATDVTNYVMFLLGQPMNAFDADQISGGLHIRKAKPGEKLRTLDHVDRELSDDDVIIADNNGIQSIAGVMGGNTSEISDATTNVYLESATWDPLSVARTSRRHKLSSEASRRFEREVDPALVEVSLDLAATLLAELGGGEVAAGRTLIGSIPEPAPIEMDVHFPSEVAGVEYPADTVINRLEEVGCTVERGAGDLLKVTPPTWRGDLSVKVDLVEEVLRLEGLESIPSILPTPVGGRGLSPQQKRRRAVGHALAYNGYAEVLPTPFIANDTFDVWGLDADDRRRQAVVVQNPLEKDYGIIGTTLLPSMLDSVARNVARGRRDMQLFGIQQVAFAGAAQSPMPDVSSRPSDADITELLDSLPQQPLHVVTVGTGETDYSGPWGEGRPYTYADAIESARVVARAAGVELEVAQGDKLPWHPGRCAQLRVGEEIIGYAGELHPQVIARLGLPARVCAMELDLTAVVFDEVLPAPALSAFPALHQDLALIVDEEVPAEQVRRLISEGAGDLLEDVELFDIYRSDSLGEGKKSLAFSLLFRAQDRTLTDEKANEARLEAAKHAREVVGAEMRG